MRLRWLIPLLIGALLGTSVPLMSASTFTYRTYLLPPSGNNGQSPALTCGFHSDACYNGAGGNFLDWDNTSTLTVSFRGTFRRSNSPYETNRLFARRSFIQGGSELCEVQRVYIIDRGELQIRGVMQYTHASMNSTAEFPIATSNTGTYNAKSLGVMINDSGPNCPWTGTHVHAGYMATGKATRYKNTSIYPSGDYCTPGVNCYNYTNNSSSNWTHYFLWSGL